MHICAYMPTLIDGTGRKSKWRAQGDDLRTFLAEFLSILPQARIPIQSIQFEALIYRDL
jgi:hypothetical protein